ncbi:fimbrial protein [Chania multitudinisentens]|uniref:fimbrial protein n=1 Tax=Chania multitudinisentens TaxID=1639108 RepID=UPI00138AB7A8|nr:fimbrial protein [Chania multitudinisentens]
MKTKKTLRGRLLALSLCGTALLLLGGSQAYAATICNPTPPISLTFPPQLFEGGADGPTIGQPLGSGWGAALSSPNFFNGDDCLIEKGLVMFNGAQPVGNYTEDGNTYTIFSTSVPSIGLIYEIKATSVANYLPVRYPVTNFYPDPRPSQTMGIDIRAKLIVIGRITSGVYPVDSQAGSYIFANGPTINTVSDSSDLVVNATTVTIKASTCQMNSATTQNVLLPPVSKSQFSGVGSSAGAGANFALTTLCGSGVKLYATMTDGSDPGNTDNILKPGDGTTALGIGVQILRNDLPISFGPDSAAAGNTNQWYIGTADGGGSESFSIPLKARYIQTMPDMVAGSVKARATVTFSYQ